FFELASDVHRLREIADAFRPGLGGGGFARTAVRPATGPPRRPGAPPAPAGPPPAGAAPAAAAPSPAPGARTPPGPTAAPSAAFTRGDLEALRDLLGLTALALEQLRAKGTRVTRATRDEWNEWMRSVHDGREVDPEVHITVGQYDCVL